MKTTSVFENGKQIEQSECRLPEQSGSLLQPVYAEKLFGKAGPLISAIKYEIWALESDLYFQIASKKEKFPLSLLANRLNSLLKSTAQNSTSAQVALQKAWLEYINSTYAAKTRRRLMEITGSVVQNPYEKILRNASRDCLDWLVTYGQPLQESEIETARHWFRQPESILAKMGEKIVKAFLHGFVSQSRDRRGRRFVRFHYQIGQEALAQQVLRILEQRGLCAIVTKPRCLVDLGQARLDHQYDKTAFFDEDLIEKCWLVEQAAYQEGSPILEETCGMIGIDQFGAKPEALYPSRLVLQPTEKQRKLANNLSQKIRSLEASFIKPSEISFCRVAFPNACLGGKFKPVFESFLEINMEESEPYERIQQVLIDALDTCVSAHLLGGNGNETDLRISFWPMKNPAKETLFLNCGSDLNIPYGEIFTTPKLSGTTGLYHISESFLRGHVFHGLRLRFQDGYLLEASCVEGDDYLRTHLFDISIPITMGEFAVGTNTKVFSLAKHYELVDRLPILITEKMGPHIAIGDPCFAGSEDAPIHNLFDGKEMVCRQNERTSKRAEDGEAVYYGHHIDITLPYDKVAKLSGLRQDGSEVSLIEDGKLVLQGTQNLNEGF